MFNEKIEMLYILNINGSSEGTQSKYFKDGYWYKEDSIGKEGYAEMLISEILSCSNLAPEEYVIYEQGLINGKYGCRSKNFLASNEDFVTFNRLHENFYGLKIEEEFAKVDGINLLYPTIEERKKYLVNFIHEMADLDIERYLSKIFTIDLISLNEDRHFNNLGLIVDRNTGKFREAPIFDNGKSLFIGNYSVKESETLEENTKRVIAKPFSGSHEEMFKTFGQGMVFDSDKVNKVINKYEKDVMTDLIMHQLLKYNLFM